MDNLQSKCAEACLSVGVVHKETPADNQFHIRNLENGKKGAGRVKIFTDLKGGIIFNWSTGQQKLFFLDDKSSYTAPTKEERLKYEQKKKEEAEKLAAKHDEIALKASSTWRISLPIESHRYLTAKDIAPNGTKYSEYQGKNKLIKKCLILPLFNEAGKVRNLQFIFPFQIEGKWTKIFLKQGETKGCFWWLGKNQENTPICLCEGFSTAASIYEATGYKTYIAYSKDNLLAIALLIRKHNPNSKVIVCADNDLKHKDKNVGVIYANEAAGAIGGFVAVPPINGDFNDYSAELKGVVK